MKFTKICMTFGAFFLAHHAPAVPLAKNLVGKDEAVYAIGISGCTYEITANKSSSGSMDEVGNVALTTRRNTVTPGFVTNFLCHASPSVAYCENSWAKEILDEDPETYKKARVRFYKKINPNYSSVVIGTSTTAVNPPVPRRISFCFTTGEKIVEGWAEIGVEGNTRAPEALAILRSLKIH